MKKNEKQTEKRYDYSDLVADVTNHAKNALDGLAWTAARELAQGLSMFHVENQDDLNTLHDWLCRSGWTMLDSMAAVAIKHTVTHTVTDVCQRFEVPKKFLSNLG